MSKSAYLAMHLDDAGEVDGGRLINGQYLWRKVEDCALRDL